VSNIELTIGMACHNDWDGTYFTLQALRLYHADVLREYNVELLVVDNDPLGPEGGYTRDLVTQWVDADCGPGKGLARATYVGAPEVEGTAAPRDLVFRRASGRVVLCLDCHVLLYPGALSALMDYYDEPEHELDMAQGPLYMDDFIHHATHMDNVWRDQMLGTWAVAWHCQRCGTYLSPREVNGGLVVMDLGCLRYNPEPILRTCACGRLIPDVPWASHEKELERAGFVPALGDPNESQPFEIPAMGLGAFACLRKHWPGFSPAFRGFGGEEFYVHEKVRRAGGRCMCLPDFRWIHRFTRPGQQVPYLLNAWNKCRNYVLGHMELGLPLDRVHTEFVGKGVIPPNQWAQMLAGADWPQGAWRPPAHHYSPKPQTVPR
jgi:hypothetical protein